MAEKQLTTTSTPPKATTPTEATIARLVKAAQSDDAQAREKALARLVQIGAPATLPVSDALLAQRCSTKRARLVEVLAALYPVDPVVVVNVLMAVLTCFPDDETRRAFRQALAQLKLAKVQVTDLDAYAKDVDARCVAEWRTPAQLKALAVASTRRR